MRGSRRNRAARPDPLSTGSIGSARQRCYHATLCRWIAEITGQIPDVHIVWKSIEGTPNSGKVTFEPVEANHTRVTLTIDYEPEGFLEITGTALGIIAEAERPLADMPKADPAVLDAALIASRALRDCCL